MKPEILVAGFKYKEINNLAEQVKIAGNKQFELVGRSWPADIGLAKFFQLVKTGRAL